MMTMCLDKQPPCQELQKEIVKLLPFLPFGFGWSYGQNYEVMINMMMMMVMMMMIKAIPPLSSWPASVHLETVLLRKPLQIKSTEMWPFENASWSNQISNDKSMLSL